MVGFFLFISFDIKKRFTYISSMNVLSLFDGMSVGQIALNRVGIKYDKYFASEIDKFAIQVTQHNYPETIQIGDVTQVKGSDLPQIDLIIGGSPCQGFSFAGKQLNFDDPRSALFFEFVRLIEECKPKYFLLENVVMKKEYEDVITQHMGVEPILINSNLVSAQNRRRLYWTNIPNIKQPEDLNIKMSDILLSGQHIMVSKQKKEHKPGGEKSSTLLARDYKGFGNQQMSGVMDNNNIRMLTPIEYERLQNVPDNYSSIVSNTQRYKMLGNGWTVDVIAHIFKNIEI
jgi:site-specific DNA-cytosine methylase